MVQSRAWFVGLALVTAFAGTRAARADVFVVADGGFGLPTIAHYSDTGQPLPAASGAVNEAYSGLALGPDGTLYAAANNVGYGSISVFNGQTGAFVRQFGPGFANNSPYAVPGGIAFGPDGNLYATTNRGSFSFDNSSFGVNGLLRFNVTTGQITGTPINRGTPASLDNRLTDVAFGPDGRAFVSTTIDGIIRSSPTIASGTTFVAPGSGGLQSPEALTFGPDGNLYVADGGTKSILRFNGTSGAFLDTFIPAGVGGLGRPSDLAFDGSGRLLVTSISSDTVLRFNGTTGAFLDTFATMSGFRLNGLAVGAVPEPSAALVVIAVGLFGSRRRARR